jgi:4-hydroxy-tetrahydrodipicolinate reductase
MRVAVFGAAGRMGAEVCRAVLADPGLELVAAVDPYHAGLDLRHVTRMDGTDGMHIESSAESLVRVEAQVAVDFTKADAAMANLAFCARRGIHAVVGTTGLSTNDMDDISALFQPPAKANCLVAANFAIGAVLLMRFAEMAAPYFESAEIIELHHDTKRDAPSGTALATAARMAAVSPERASCDEGGDGSRAETLEGARGARGPGGIQIHSVRMKGLVAHEEVLFGTTGQTLSLRHDSYDRASFMPGVLLAIKAVAERPGLTVGLESVLGL